MASNILSHITTLLVLINLQPSFTQRCCMQLKDWKSLSRSTVSGLIQACADGIFKDMEKEFPNENKKKILSMIGHSVYVEGVEGASKRSINLMSNNSSVSDALYDTSKDNLYMPFPMTLSGFTTVGDFVENLALEVVKKGNTGKKGNVQNLSSSELRDKENAKKSSADESGKIGATDVLKGNDQITNGDVSGVNRTLGAINDVPKYGSISINGNNVSMDANRAENGGQQMEQTYTNYVRDKVMDKLPHPANAATNDTNDSENLNICLFRKLNQTSPEYPPFNVDAKYEPKNSTYFFVGPNKECRAKCLDSICDTIPPANVVMEWTGYKLHKFDDMMSICMPPKAYYFRRTCYGGKSTDQILFKMLAQKKFRHKKVHAYMAQMIALYAGFFPDSSRIVDGSYMTKNLDALTRLIQQSGNVLSSQDIANAKQRLRLTSDDFVRIFRESRYMGKREIYRELLDEIRDKLTNLELGQWHQTLLDTLQCQILNQDKDHGF